MSAKSGLFLKASAAGGAEKGHNLYKVIQWGIAAIFSALLLLVFAHNPLTTLLLAAAIFCIFLFLFQALKHCSEKLLLILFFILLPAFCLLNYHVGFLLRVIPAWDFGRVYSGIQDLIQYGNFATTWSYFLESPNNIFITLWLTGWTKFAALFGPVSLMKVILFINSLSMSFAILFMFLTLKRILGTQSAFFAAFLCFISTPLYAYSPIVYSDTISMPFVSLNFFLAVKLCDLSQTKTSRQILWAILSGLSAFVGYQLKPTALFPFLALALYCLFARHDLIKHLLLLFVVFAVCMLLYQVWLSHTELLDYSQLDLYRLPPMHYFRIGLIGSGGYDPASHGLAQSLPDAGARTSQAWEQIKQLLSTYVLDGTLLTHLKDKLLYTWNDGLYFSPGKLAIDPVCIDDLHNIVLADGTYFPLYQTYSQSIHLCMLCMLVWTSIRAALKKIKDIPAAIHIALICVLGVFVFLLLWETRSRYLVNMIPLFLFCEAWGISQVSSILFHKRKLKHS